MCIRDRSKGFISCFRTSTENVTASFTQKPDTVKERSSKSSKYTPSQGAILLKRSECNCTLYLEPSSENRMTKACTLYQRERERERERVIFFVVQEIISCFTTLFVCTVRASFSNVALLYFAFWFPRLPEISKTLKIRRKLYSDFQESNSIHILITAYRFWNSQMFYRARGPHHQGAGDHGVPHRRRHRGRGVSVLHPHVQMQEGQQ